MSALIDQLDRRIDRGFNILGSWFRSINLGLRCAQIGIFIGIVLMSPVLAVAWLIGYISESRENRRNAVEDVRD